MLRKSVIILIIALLSYNISADELKGLIDDNDNFESYYVISSGLNYRVDERDYLVYKPEIHLKFLRYFNSNTAIKFELSHSFLIKQKDITYTEKKYKNTSFEMGIRKSYPKILFNLFIEFGIGMHNYDYKTFNLKTNRFGFKFTGGLELPMTKSVSVDFGLSHTLNKLFWSEKYPLTDPTTPPDIYSGVILSSFNNRIFNPTKIEILLNIKL